MLSDFITSHRDEIVARTRAKIAARTVPSPTELEMHHVPLLLDQLAARLRTDTAAGAAEMSASASLHGGELLNLGLTVGQVVHDYGNACQSITTLAAERGTQIAAADYAVLNRCLDGVIADAVTEFARQREDTIVGRGAEHLGSLVHEMRNLLSTAMLSFESLLASNLGVEGRTGQMLSRSLERMRDLIDRSLAEVRLEAGTAAHERVVLAEVLEEIEVSAVPDAAARHVQLSVAPVGHDVAVEADHQILTSVVANLVQNACKFTQPNGHVALRTIATPDRVVIEVEDECGGLPPGKAEELFRPFEQRGADRSGLGLGLTICQKGVHAMHGEIHVRDVPGHGCVFTVELPRSPAPQQR